MRSNLLFLLFLPVAAGLALAGPEPQHAALAGVPSPFEGLRFLAGGWQGQGGGRPGQGGGSFSFEPDLDGRVWVRRSHSEYPGAGGKAPTVHDDLMVVYPEPATGGLVAVYFDNEGHVIRYAVAVAAGEGRAVFVSDPTPTAPRFRLTYARSGEATVDVVFEVAPPGQPNAFARYVSGRASRISR